MKRATRRGFTLLEMMLAAILGAMVVLACMAMFMSIDRQMLVGQGRYEETLGLAQTHETIERSIQLLVMSDSQPPIEPSPSSRTANSGATGESAAALTPSETPRLLLQFDPLGDGAIRLHDGREIPPQRLEVALRSPPIFVPRDERREQAAESSRDERRRRRAAEAAERRDEREASRSAGRSAGRGGDGAGEGDGKAGDPADGGGERDAGGGAQGRGATGSATGGTASTPLEDLVDITIAPGLRGAFELVFDPPRPGRLDEEGSWSLWWRQLGAEGRSSLITEGGNAQATLWPEGMVPGATRLVAGIERLHWRVYRRGEWLDEWSATWPDDLPAYVSLEILMTSGTYHEWLFEIGWTVGKEPGTESRVEPPAPNQDANPNARPRPGASTPSGTPSSRPAPATPAPARSNSGSQRGGR